MISPLEVAEDGQPTGEPDGGHLELPDELDAVREMVLRAYPDVVPELVAGDSVTALLASVEPARSAYARLAEVWTGSREVTSAPVPAGGGAVIAVDPDRLPAAEKIRRGLVLAEQRKG